MNLEVIDALHILVHELYECAVARGTANGESADFGARGQEKEPLHGRSLHVSVPPAPGRSPVLILLHANTDNGDRLLKRFLRRGGPLAALAERVPPSPANQQWRSRRP